jgi:hypothetical protein
MNYIKHLTGFFDKVAKDRMLNPTHVSLYMSLFQFWNYNRFKNPISISRDEVMRISKISSKATYHKCLKMLHAQGYIKYEPSYNPFKGSHVFLFNFSEDLKPLPKNNSSNFKLVDEQVVDKSCTGSETSTEQVYEQVVVPYINNTNNTNDLNNSNSLNLGEQAKKIEEDNSIFKNGDDLKEEKSSAKKEEMPVQSSDEKKDSSSQVFADYGAECNNISRQILAKVKPPDLDEVKSHFLQQNFPEIEAQKFYNYFSSIGWLVGGKIPMADWQAAASNWMLNAPKFILNERTDRTKQLDTSANKDYSEPL